MILFALACQSLLDFFDTIWRRTTVEYRVTVRAHWSQILNRIDLVFAVGIRKSAKVMDMDKTLRYWTVDNSEAKPQTKQSEP